MKPLKIAAWLMLASFSLQGAPAQAQSKTMTPQEQANLKLVVDWWREVIQAGHMELAPQYMAEDYIQHNPNISTGRAAFVQRFGSRPPQPIPETLANPPIIQFAKGDYVVLVWGRESKDPSDASKTYRHNSFDLVRVQNGKLQEHWDSALKNAPTPGEPAAVVVPGVGPAPMAQKNTAAEQKNEELANILFKDILQYGHVELAPKVMAAGYIQHNPLVPTGRDGFVEFFSKVRKPEPIKPEWKQKPALILTSGNLVMYMMDRQSADPVDPSKTYQWSWFDLVRVDDGMIQEHWDAAMKSSPPAAAPPPAR